jgi:hypothetical protein
MVAALVALALSASLAIPAGADAPPAGTVDVRVVDPGKYFAAKAAGQAVSPQDTLDLISQDGHKLLLELLRWSVDHSPSLVAPLDPAQPRAVGSERISYFPTPDTLAQALNAGAPDYSYTKRNVEDQGTGLYPNPVSATSEHDWDGHPVPLGWTPAAAGNFTYLYQVDGQGHVISFQLYFYAPTRESGYDMDGDGQPDGVLLHLAGGALTTRQQGEATGRALAQDLPWYCNGVQIQSGM